MVQKQYRFAPKSIFTFVFLCFVAIVVIISTSSLVQVEESLDPIEVSDEIKKHDRKVVIFPSNFQSGNNKLADFLTEAFGQRLNKGDIVYKIEILTSYRKQCILGILSICFNQLVKKIT